MSLLVHYTLKSEDHHEAQKLAMSNLVEGLKSENLTGLHYSCFATEDPLQFVGVLEYRNDAEKQAFFVIGGFCRVSGGGGPNFLQSSADNRDFRNRIDPRLMNGSSRSNGGTATR